jgi:SAM-dependent methyltransferase
MGIQQKGRYLDLACGTGNYATALARLGGHWHGFDQSERMLRAAHGKLDEVDWCVADASALPYPDEWFSGGICILAVHHFGDLSAVFAEAGRVLACGRLIIFTSTPEQMSGFWIKEYFPAAMERAIRQMPSLGEVQSGLLQAGFRLVCCESYAVRPDLQGKHHPHLYLSPAIRRGISTFAMLADPNEEAAGCARLRQDIASRRVWEVAARYEHKGGDYMFIAAEKPALG